MSKHTPGPWTKCCSLSSPNILVDICDQYGNNIVRDMGRHSPDATLIAAAPEMLEALEAVFQARAWQLNFDFAGHSDMQKLVSAIKKAKGEL